MALTHTRTHTYFWSEDQVAALEVEVEKMAADWAGRKKHVSSELAQRGDKRVMLLRAVVALCREEAD